MRYDSQTNVSLLNGVFRLKKVIFHFYQPKSLIIDESKTDDDAIYSNSTGIKSSINESKFAYLIHTHPESFNDPNQIEKKQRIQEEKQKWANVFNENKTSNTFIFTSDSD